MFGHDAWRPLTVAVLVSGAVFLPQGVASAAPSDSLSCAQMRNSRVDCTPLRHDGVDGLFIGPVSASREPNKGSSSPAGMSTSGSSAAGTATTGSASTGSGTSGSGAGGSTATSGAGTGSSPAGSSGTSDAAAGGTATAGAATGGTTAGGTTAGGATTGGATAGGTTPGEPPVVAPPAPAAPTVAPSPVPVPDPDWSTTSSSGPTSTGASGDDSDEAKSEDKDKKDDDDKDSKSKQSSGSSSDDSDSSKSSSGSSSGSSGGSYSGTTSAGSVLGAASCPSTVGTGSTPTSARGSVTTGAQTPEPQATDPRGAASLTDVSGGGNGNAGYTVGTATRATAQALAATAGTASSVAGTALGATTKATGGNANLPGDVLNLGYWYLTLPTGQQGSPDTIENPTLEKFTNNFFKLNPTRDGVVFSADGAGVTTKNSHYPRSELREMNGGEKASWSNTSGSHTLDVCEAITKVPSAKPHVVAAQIHDGNDDVMQIRLEGKTLMVQYNDGKSNVVMDPNYNLGTPYNVRIVAANGKVDVLYNGVKKAELPLAGSGWYWKVGAYVQSNSTKGDGAGSVGEVTVYTLNCVHA